MPNLRAFLSLILGILILCTVLLSASHRELREEIHGFEARLIDGLSTPRRAGTTEAGVTTVADLPEPVRRYFAFTFPEGPPTSIAATDILGVEVEMRGQFRRPLADDFHDTAARQIVDARSPGMVFSANTWITPPIWAIAYDAYLEGEMEMEARVLSAFTVMHQGSTPDLDRASLRRWLIESPTYPTALLPGGPVTWEPIDDRHARAVARAHGVEAALVATFRDDGSLARFDAEEDGDLSTPYHGSGEHVERRDYRRVDGIMIPMAFTIARAADGDIFPFWQGRITTFRFLREDEPEAPPA